MAGYKLLDSGDKEKLEEIGEPSSAKATAGKANLKIKKPQGEKAVLDFILGKFKPTEADILKKVLKKSSEAIQTLVANGRDRAMNIFN